MRKTLLQMVCEGNQLQAPHILFQWVLLADASVDADRKLNAVLGWLVRNRLTGQRFVTWVHAEHQNSAYLAFTAIIQKLERAAEKKPIFADNKQ